MGRQRVPCPSSAGKHMPQPPVLPSQPRLRSLERLEAEIVKAETDRSRWVIRAESLRAQGLGNRAELALVQIAEARLACLNHSREVLLEGDAGRAEPEVE